MRTETEATRKRGSSAMQFFGSVRAGTGACLAWCLVCLPAQAADAVLADMKAVRAEWGLPQAIRFRDGGVEVWEYHRKVTRNGAWRYAFDPAGKVLSVERIRTAEDVAAIVVSETQASEVVALLGSPDRIVPDGDGVGWQFQLPQGGTLVLGFAAGKIVSTKTVTR
jgi:hypothetical protein